MFDIEMAPTEGTPFEAIVAETNWQDPEIAKRLRVAGELSTWLVEATEAGGLNLIGFSIEAVDSDEPLSPPKNLTEVQERLPKVRLLFNTDQTAKGLGSLITNSPYALQPHATHGSDIAVRSLPLFPPDEYIPDRTDSQTAAGRGYGILRHGGLVLASELENRRTHSTKGTRVAMAFMERHYGDARLVGMPPAPSWQREYKRDGIVQPVQPHVMLVRGGRDHGRYNEMTRVGTYSAHRSTEQTEQ